MVLVKEAIEIILNDVRPLGFEKVSLLDSLGRVLGEDIYSDRLIPPKDNSAMDGYAIRVEDIKGASMESPCRLKVIGDIPAGHLPDRAIKAGEAVRIMTGAPIPEGADAVVMKEDTVSDRSDVVDILREVDAGTNIRRAGEDVRPGELIIKKGTVIAPPDMAMMAALGRSLISVYQRPRVSILATGDEIVDIDEPLTEGKIVNSNSFGLYAQVLSVGAIPVLIGIARDSKEAVLEKLNHALTGDVIISTGGVSVGDYDFVKDVLKEMGVEVRFWKVAIKPGKPIVYGLIGRKPVFGLPGNPVSSMVAFEEFVGPALSKMMGKSAVFRKTVKGIITEDTRKKPGRRHFIQAVIEEKDGEIYATPLARRGSGMLSSLVRSQGLIVLGEDVEEIKKGERVSVQILRTDFMSQTYTGF